MAQQDAFLDEIDALIEKHAPTAAPAATASTDQDPVLAAVDAILAPYEVPETEREATAKALEVGKWPGDESIRPTIEKGGRKAFDAVRDARIPQMRQVHKARETETALHEKDSFTNRATEFAKSLFGSSEPAPVAQTAPLPVPAGPSLSPSPLHTPTPRSGPLPVQQLVSNISKEDKSAAGDVVLAYKRRQIDLDEAHRQLRDIYGRYTDDPDQPDQFGHTLRDMLAQTTRRPENPEAINPESLPPIATMVERYKSANPLERGPKVGPDKLHPFERASEAPPPDQADDYDYEAARAAGVQPQVDPHETAIDPKTGQPYLHWDSKFKKDHHPHRFLPTELGVYDSKNNRLVPTDEFNQVATPAQRQTVQTEQPLPASEVQQYLGNSEQPDLILPEITVRPDDQAPTSPSWLQPGLANNYESPEVMAPSMARPSMPTEAAAPSQTTIGQDIAEAANNFMRGAVDVTGSALKSIAIASKTVDDYLPEALKNPADIKERMTYKIGQAVQDMAAKAFPTDPARQKEFMASVLPRALGSMTAFLAGGIGGAVVKAPMTTTALMGAGAQGTEQFEDAAAHGADPATQQQAFWLGVPVGATEAIPIGGLIERFNHATGGRFMHILKTAGVAAAEEFAQEFFQTTAGNVIAKDILEYDQQRSRIEGATEAGEAGGAAGAILGILVGALGGRRAMQQRTGAADVPATNEPLAQGSPASAPATVSAPPPIEGVPAQEQPAPVNLKAQPKPAEIERAKALIKDGALSPAQVQQNLKVGYPRAARIVEELKRQGLVQTPAPVERPTPIERPAAQERPAPIERPTPVPKPDEITPEMREAMDYVNEYEVEERPAPVERPKAETKPAPVETTAPKIETKGPIVETPAPVERPQPTTNDVPKSEELVVAPESRAEVAPAQEAAPLPIEASQPVEKQEVGETKPPKADSPVSVADQQPSRFAHIDGAHNAAALELRSTAYEKERTGDVLLDNGKFVSFDHAVRLAREGIESGEVRPVPFQLYDRLGIAIRDAKRVIKEAAKPSPASDISPTVMSETTAPIDRAAHEAATSPTNDRPEPTPAQKEEGNYKKGHVTIGGLPISIENPQGSTRSGVSKSGKAWSVEMKSHYGYLKGTVGKDKDQIDAFVKPGTPGSYDGPVYVVDQKDPSTDRFDEHKTVIGAGSLNEAKRIYQENYAKGWKGLQSITRFSMPEFKAWLKSGETKKPAANYTPTQQIVKSDNVEIPPAVSVPPARTPAAFPVPPKGTKTSAGKVVPSEVLADYPEAQGIVKTDQSVSPEPKTTRKKASTRSKSQNEQGAPIREFTESPSAPEPSGDRRSRGIPAEADPPIASYRNNETVKAHPDYRAAKAGDMPAATRLVRELVTADALEAARTRFSGATFVSAFAQEASGKNAIPQALAIHYAKEAGGRMSNRLVQTNRVFHTGADAMQRLIARPRFAGEVTAGERYVLVDDVNTMGGTLAEMANYIQSHGGRVVGVVTLTNASRGGILTPSRALVRLLEQRFGDAIRETFGIDPSALTASEANYLGHFRDADALRTRGVAASQQRERRLSAKGVSRRDHPSVADQPTSEFGAPQRDAPDTAEAAAASRRAPRTSLKHLTDIERQAREVADDFLAAVDQAKSKPRPTRPRIPIAPILGGGPKTLANIVIDVQKGIGKKVTTGKPGRGLSGVYKPGSATTMVRYSGDLDTTAHELAHALDDEYGIVKAYKGQPSSPFDAELKPFGEHGSVQTTGPRSTATYWRAEGVAEWTRAWLVNPLAAEAAAPTFTQHFKHVVPAHIQKALQAFSDDIRRHAGQSAHAKIMANVEWDTPKSPLLAWLTGTRTAPGPGFQLTIGDQLATELTDRLTPFMKAVRYAQGQRNAERPLPGKDPALLARLYMGVNAKLDDVFEHGMIDAQLQSATPGGLTWLLGPLDPQALEAEIQEVASLMIAQRTMEKSRQLERDRISGIGAGIESDVSVARARLAELKQDPAKYARLQDAASRYRQWADANLRYLVDKGRLSAEQYAAIKENNEFYVAMQRIIEVSPGEELVVSLPRGTAGRKLGTVGQPVKSFGGSTRTIKNPYHALMDATNQAIREADRNEVLSLFRDLLTMDREMHEGQVADLASVGRLAATGEKHTIPIYKNGTKEVWQFHPDIYKALKGVEEGLVKLPWEATLLPRILRATIVNAPPFALRNLIRDAWLRTIVSRVGSKLWDVLKPYSKDEITRFRRSGGDQAGHYYTDPQEYGRALQFAMRELSGKKGSILVDPARLGRGYLNLMQASERQGRMAEYRRAFQHAKKEFGYDDYHASLWAAGQSRDLLDFAVAGNTVAWLNQLIPFTNAAVQGLRRNIKGARENPAGVALRFGIYALIPSLMNFAWNYLFGDGDDLDEYRELPAYQRDLFYNYKLGPDQWLSIPKAFEVGVLATTFERAMDYGLGNEKAFEGHVGAFLRTLLPIDEAAFGGPFQGIFQAVANYDFFRDRPIVPRYEENLALDLRNTHRASRLGQAIQAAIGVDARKVDFVVEQQFGYFGRYATKASDIGRQEKRGFGLDTVGLFRGSPATAALDVQKIKEIATERGLVASRGKAVDKYQTVSAVPARPTEHVKNPDAVRFGVFRKLLDAYYEAKGPEAKDAAAKILRREAAALRTIWEKTPPRQQAEEKAEITRKRDTGAMSKDEATKAFKEMMKPKRHYAPFPMEPAVTP